MGHDNGRLAPGTMMAGGYVSGSPALLQELLDHAKGNPEVLGHFFSRALLLVVGSQNSFA
jgi:hypothetical protein